MITTEEQLAQQRQAEQHVARNLRSLSAKLLVEKLRAHIARVGKTTPKVRKALQAAEKEARNE
jgi:hypothetical protein